MTDEELKNLTVAGQEMYRTILADADSLKIGPPSLQGVCEAEAKLIFMSPSPEANTIVKLTLHLKSKWMSITLEIVELLEPEPGFKIIERLITQPKLRMDYDYMGHVAMGALASYNHYVNKQRTHSEESELYYESHE